MEITLIAIIAVGIFWYSSMQGRERGLSIARQTCRETGHKLIDDTILLSHISIKRDREGQLRLRRIYTFRYLDSENFIFHGTLILLGKQQESLLLDSHPPS